MQIWKTQKRKFPKLFKYIFSEILIGNLQNLLQYLQYITYKSPM